MATRRPDELRLLRLRQSVAEAAARLLANGEQTDPDRARRKAAEQLGVRREAELPTTEQVREAALAYRRLFATAEPLPQLQPKREAALEAMQFMAAFEPRLAGELALDDGSGQAPVLLHLHADDPDDVAHFLHGLRIAADQAGRRVRLDRDTSATFPLWQFQAGGLDFELLVLPRAALRQPPLDADGQVAPRLSAPALARRLGR